MISRTTLKGEDMSKALSLSTTFASLQWFIFIFANIVVVPISVGTAFMADPPLIAELIRNSLVMTGIACILQGTIGHRFPLLEGHSGLMWGFVLNLSFSAHSLGMSLTEIGGGIATGMLISGVLVMVLAVFRSLTFLEKIFTPMVQTVFLFLLTFQLILIFFEGMFKIADDGTIVLPESLFSLAVVVFVCILTIFGKQKIGNYSILIGMAVGWLFYVLLFPAEQSADLTRASFNIHLFPLGAPNLNVPIIAVTCLASLINLSNTITAVKTAAGMFKQEASSHLLNRSYLLNGLFSVAGGVFGLVSYSPFASTIGFLQSTRIYDRKPFLIGGALLALIGLLPLLTGLLATLPVTVGNAVLLVAYLQLLGTSLNSLNGYTFNSVTIYRLAIPVLIGLGILSFDPKLFSGLPVLWQPLVSNGFIVGMILSIFMELLVDWEKLERKS